LQNHPNPFNASTEIRFELPEPGRVKLKIYNLQGQEVRRLLNEEREAGYHSVYFDGRNNQGQYLTSGVYIFTLEAGSNIETKKMILIR
jgi:flagellar hook assembly protein FlgD